MKSQIKTLTALTPPNQVTTKAAILQGFVFQEILIYEDDMIRKY